MNKGNLFSPIPNETVPKTDGIKIVPVDDPLICISKEAPEHLLFQPRYFEEGIPGSIPRVYVRKTVADKLAQAASLLPAGYKFLIFDAWRPAAVQKALFDEYHERLRETYRGTGKTEDELMEMALLFVSYPSSDPDAPFVHSTGGAVDLTIVDETGKALDMGTDFDDFSDFAHTAYFENTDSAHIRDNRRLLYNVMTAAGFTNFPSEWWHYDFGDRFWAAINHQDSIYRGIYVEPDPFAP